MPSNNERLYHELGEVKGMLASMDKRFNSFDKRLERMEAKQDDVLKKVARNSVVCGGVFSAAIRLITSQFGKF